MACHVAAYGFGDGAFYFKHVRCGDLFALRLLTNNWSGLWAGDSQPPAAAPRRRVPSTCCPASRASGRVCGIRSIVIDGCIAPGRRVGVRLPHRRRGLRGQCARREAGHAGKQACPADRQAQPCRRQRVRLLRRLGRPHPQVRSNIFHTNSRTSSITSRNSLPGVPTSTACWPALTASSSPCPSISTLSTVVRHATHVF